MRPKSLMLLALALGCGLVAAIGINQVLANRGSQVVVQQGDTEPIFVAMVEIPLGEPLSPQVVKLEQWPKDRIPEGAIHALEEIENRRTRTSIYPGEPILDAKLLSKDASKQGATALIPPGYRVVSVKVDAVSGGSSLILPGDRVDLLVFLQQSPTRGIHNTGTRTVLQDVKVFAVNERYRPTPQEQMDDSISAKTISLLVTPEQAELVTLASEMGKLRLVMRSPEDDAEVSTDGALAIDLIQGKKSDREGEDLMEDEPAEEESSEELLTLLETEPEPTPEPKLPVIEGPKLWTMLVLEGSDARQIDFYDDGKTVITRPLLSTKFQGGPAATTPAADEAAAPGDEAIEETTGVDVEAEAEETDSLDDDWFPEDEEAWDPEGEWLPDSEIPSDSEGETNREGGETDGEDSTPDDRSASRRLTAVTL